MLELTARFAAPATQPAASKAPRVTAAVACHPSAANHSPPAIAVTKPSRSAKASCESGWGFGFIVVVR
jgi:hypothetical protein